MNDKDLRNFLAESNKIEGITRVSTDDEVHDAQLFLVLPTIIVADLQALVSIFQPGATLRDKPGMNVRVGDHIAPPGGPDITHMLKDILERAQRNWLGGDPFSAHKEYERIHPFTDCNGRSGRMLWLWQMGDSYSPRLGFLHHWYYQSLSAGRTP